MTKNIRKTFAYIMNLFIGINFLIILLFFIQLFCLTSFKIPSNSMEPTLKNGDRILVNKMIKGARLFNVFAALKNKDVTIHRMPGVGKFKRGDILVFNFPYQMNHWDSIRMDVMQYYVKRCIALPGDTLEIRLGIYKVRGCNNLLDNYNSQYYLTYLEHPEQWDIAVNTFPYDTLLRWNIREFGPLAIPKIGQKVMMSSTAYQLYRQLISWEQKKKLSLKNHQVFLGDSLIFEYKFKKNYYFVSGDNMVNSQDSRYWGMLPEEYIIGKATHIWYSKNEHTGTVNWKRIMKNLR